MKKYGLMPITNDFLIMAEIDSFFTVDGYLKDSLPEIGNVTSRDMIINPHTLVDPNRYKKNRAGQARYKSDLAALEIYAQQQEAAYQEWYNSAEQQVIREREAGLNPDLTDFSGAPASQTNGSSINPIDGIPTNAQLSFDAISSVSSIVSGLSGIANLATSFSQINLLRSQSVGQNLVNESQELANIETFQRIASGQISDRLASAMSAATSLGQSFNIDDWFNDEANFSDIVSTYAPTDNPRYQSAFSSAKKATLQHHKNALSQLSEAAKNQTEYANMLSDPRYSPDVLLQIAQLQPFMAELQSLRELRLEFDKVKTNWDIEYQNSLDPELVGESANAQNQFNEDYWRGLNGKKQALYDTYIKSAEAAKSRMSQAINDNLYNLYLKNKDNLVGMAAAYLFTGGAGLKWAEFLSAWAATMLNDVSSDSSQQVDERTGTTPVPDSARAFIPPGAAVR